MKYAMPRESAKTVKDELKFMKKGGAPKKLLDHERAEHQKMRAAKKAKR